LLGNVPVILKALREDYDRLGKCGLSRSQILELIAMSGLAVYANIMADATAMEPDAMFSAL
jgi:alkylhydroperoxidase family enzyme